MYVLFYICVMIDFVDLTVKEKGFTIYIIRGSLNMCLLVTEFHCPEVAVCRTFISSY